VVVTPVALTIAGSDPSGGAGIQADLKTFHQFGVYGEAVITLLTVQNSRAVSRVETVPTDFVCQQVSAVVEDIPPLAAKTGALGSREIVETVAELASRFSFPLIVDPVTVSKHGAPLLSRDANAALRARLLPYAALVTPNIPEAELLTGVNIETQDDMKRAAEAMLRFGCQAVLLKAGHLTGEPVDLLLDEHGFAEYPGVRVAGCHTHGTGCTYSAAITANIALGQPLRQAVNIAKQYIQNALETAPLLGSGSGPINHFASSRFRTKQQEMAQTGR
jgi:hydroxymethylpyrimidine/phosphomethylpyrimidine kinase